MAHKRHPEDRRVVISDDVRVAKKLATPGIGFPAADITVRLYGAFRGAVIRTPELKRFSEEFPCDVLENDDEYRAHYRFGRLTTIQKVQRQHSGDEIISKIDKKSALYATLREEMKEFGRLVSPGFGAMFQIDILSRAFRATPDHHKDTTTLIATLALGKDMPTTRLVAKGGKEYSGDPGDLIAFGAFLEHTVPYDKCRHREKRHIITAERKL